jgi:hypothetical protein
MESSPGTTQPARRKPFEVPIVFAPIYIPLFFIVGALSIPWTYFQKSRQRNQEKKFAEQMKKTGRLMRWEEFQRTEPNGEGTAIGEYLSMKGPFRLWWTPDDIPATCPHNWNREKHFAWMEPEFLPFFQWCYARYTNPQTGSAHLVLVPDEVRARSKAMLAMLTSRRFVSTCSFPSVRGSTS